MTYKVVIGADPGQTGALAVLADGVIERVFDMPVVARAAGGNELNGALLADELRDVWHKHPGANFLAVLEAVSAMPDQGVSGAFRFGDSFGGLRCTLEALKIATVRVPPAVWKRALGLTGKPKDAARALAIQRYPAAAEHLKRKKDIGRADAILLAHWATTTEQIA